MLGKLKPLFIMFIYPAVLLVSQFKELLVNSTDDILQYFINLYSEELAPVKIGLIIQACRNLNLFSKMDDKETDIEKLQYIIQQLKTMPVTIRDGFYLQLATSIFLLTADAELEKYFDNITTSQANYLTQQAYVLFKQDYFN